MANPPLDPANPVGTGPRASASGQAAVSLRVLFLGRRLLAEELTRLVAQPALAARVQVTLVALTTQKAALRALRQQPPKLVLVETSRAPEARARFGRTVRTRLPAVALFAVGAVSSADEHSFSGYLPLPLSTDAVAAAVTFAAGQDAGHILQRGPIRLNVATRTVTTPSGQHHMTPKQCALLQMLLENVDHVLSRSQIMQAVWETDYMEDTRTLDVHIRWLRERIEPDPSTPVYLLTVRGRGYTLHLP
jgi:DNA-binding response OmpR family regulator